MSTTVKIEPDSKASGSKGSTDQDRKYTFDFNTVPCIMSHFFINTLYSAFNTSKSKILTSRSWNINNNYFNMIQKFELGKIYKFIEDGEDLTVEHSYQTFFKNMNLNKDSFGYYTVDPFVELIYVPITSGTIALCLGSDETKILNADFKTFASYKYYKLLVEDQVVILLHKEKNLYSFEEIPVENY